MLAVEVSGEQEAVKLFGFFTDGFEVAEFLVEHFINLVAPWAH